MGTFLYIYLIGYIANFFFTLKVLSEVGDITKKDLVFSLAISLGSWISIIALFSYLDDQKRNK